MTKEKRIEAILKAAPVVPVVTIEDAAHAVPLARALVAGGLPAIEVTLRTDAAYDAARAIRAEVQGAFLGLGTVLHKNQIEFAAEIGADFMVSPGGAPRLLDAADEVQVPLLPGAATASEAMTLLERGHVFQKFFPAEPAGGPSYLKALAQPLPAIRFCPTGGVTAANAAAWLACPNVICVGGSWVAPEQAMRAGDWPRIETLAREAAGLAR